jgi:hypothetical protein
MMTRSEEHEEAFEIARRAEEEKRWEETGENG